MESLPRYKEDDLILKENYLFTCSQFNYHQSTFKNFIYNLSKNSNNNNVSGTITKLNTSKRIKYK